MKEVTELIRAIMDRDELFSCAVESNPQISDAKKVVSGINQKVKGYLPKDLFLELDDTQNALCFSSFESGILYGLYLSKLISDIPSVAGRHFRNGTLWEKGSE